MNSKFFYLLLALILLEVAYSADCELCTYSDDGKKTKGDCTPCDEGTCTLQTGTIGTDQSVCQTRKCQAGQKSKTGFDTNGTGEGCVNCEEGTNSLEGSKICNIIPCGYGFYSDTGYYDLNEYYECDYQCPDGKTTKQINTIGKDDSVCDVQLFKCPAGKWSQSGYYPEGNEAECKDCDIGTYSEEGSEDCYLRPCEHGTYSKTGYYNIYEQDQCDYQCPDGKTTKQINTKGEDDRFCEVDANKCPKGKYSQTGYDLVGNGEGCKDCNQGSYSEEGSKKCHLRPCKLGFYSPSGYYNVQFDKNCNPCPNDKSTLNEKTKGENDSVCTLQLKKCPAGYWSVNGYDGNRKGSQCRECDYGTYSEEGSTKCNIIFCEKGYYSKRGYYYENENNDCNQCPEGKSTLNQNTTGENYSACNVQLKLCPKGTYSFTGYDSDGNGNGCYDCDDGFYSFEGSKECNLQPCGYGFYSETGYYVVDKERECLKCPTGKSTLKDNQIGKDVSACDFQFQLCPAGRYSYTGYSFDRYEISCFFCGQGTHSQEGSTECNLISCGYGFYSKTGYYDSKTQTSCNPCPKNTTTLEYQTISLDDSVCISSSSSSSSSDKDIENPPNFRQNDPTTTSSIIIQITLNLILLVTIF